MSGGLVKTFMAAAAMLAQNPANAADVKAAASDISHVAQPAIPIAYSDSLISIATIPGLHIVNVPVAGDTKPSTLIISERGAKELGGLEVVKSAFAAAETVRSTYLVVTNADLDHANSDLFRRSEENEDTARVRYLDETYSPAMVYLHPAYKNFLPEEQAAFWNKQVAYVNTSYIVGGTLEGNNRSYNTAFLDTENISDFFPNLRGTDNQKLAFLLGHEIGHFAALNSKSGANNVIRDALADSSGISAAESVRPLEKNSASSEEFSRSIISERLRNTLYRIAGVAYNPRDYSLYDAGHDTAFLLNGDGTLSNPEGIEQDIKAFKAALSEIYDDDTEIQRSLLSYNPLPDDPIDIIWANDVAAKEFYEENLPRMLKLLGLPEDKRTEINSAYDDLVEVDDPEYKNIRAFLNELRDTHKGTFDSISRYVFYDDHINIDSLIKHPSISDPERYAYSTEMDSIKSQDEEVEVRFGVNYFMYRFKVAHPEAYRDYYTNEQAPAFLANALLYNKDNSPDLDLANKVLRDITLSVYKDEKSDLSDRVRKTLRIYLEESGVPASALGAAPEAPPALRGPI